MKTKAEKSFLRGYSLVLHSFLTYLIYGTLAGVGVSTIVRLYAEKNNLDQNIITSVNTIGGFVGVIMTFVIGSLIVKRGPRLVTCFSCLATAVGLLILGYGQTLGMYIVWAAICQSTFNGYSWSSTNALMTNWFPRKKGFVMGITTAGMMAASFTTIMFMTAFSPIIGFDNVCLIFAIGIAVFGLITLAWVRDTPEECGLLPDNMEMTAAERARLGGGENPQVWKIRDLVFSKDGMLFIFGWGLLYIASTGGATAFVPYMIEEGFTPTRAVFLMSIMSVCSALGSLLLGAVDTKFGTKKASLLFALMYTVGYTGAWLAHANPWAAFAMATCALTAGGANANLVASTLVEQYGRPHYAHVWKILYTGANLLRNLCFLAIGTIVSLSGTYSRVFLFWGVVSLVSFFCVLFSNYAYRSAPNASN